MRTRFHSAVCSLAVVFLTAIRLLAADENWDTTNAGLAQLRLKVSEWVSENKPTGELKFSDDSIKAMMSKKRDVSVPSLGGGAPQLKKGFTFLNNVKFKYHTSWEIRTRFLAVVDEIKAAGADEEKLKRVVESLPDSLAAIKARINSQKQNLDAVLTYEFLKDWYLALTPNLEGLSTYPEKAQYLETALHQSSYQILVFMNEIQVSNEASAGELPQNGGGSSESVGTSSRTSGYHHADVIHERLMNGIYRRHNRHMNQIERITARR